MTRRIEGQLFDRLIYRPYIKPGFDAFMRFIVDSVLKKGCYGCGYVCMKLLTVGKYPSRNTKHRTVCYFGLLVVLLLLFAYVFRPTSI